MRTPEKIIKFYHSVRWKRARQLKMQLARGVCEECGERGTEVHHIIPLTLENVDNPLISMGQDNLQLLCKSCHDAKRSDEIEVRNDIEFDKDGNPVKKLKRKAHDFKTGGGVDF